MKLARVQHERCDEIDATTAIMVPDELTEDELDEAASRAAKAYEKARDEWLQANQAPGMSTYFDWRKLPAGTTIEEANKLYDNRERNRKEWEAKRYAATANFAYYLLKEIPGSKYIWDVEALEIVYNWGHQHGKHIAYGTLENKDLKGSSQGDV